MLIDKVLNSLINWIQSSKKVEYLDYRLNKFLKKDPAIMDLENYSEINSVLSRELMNIKETFQLKEKV